MRNHFYFINIESPIGKIFYLVAILIGLDFETVNDTGVEKRKYQPKAGNVIFVECKPTWQIPYHEIKEGSAVLEYILWNSSDLLSQETRHWLELILLFSKTKDDSILLLGASQEEVKKISSLLS